MTKKQATTPAVEQAVPGLLPEPDKQFFKSDLAYRRSLYYVNGWNAHCRDLHRKSTFAAGLDQPPGCTTPAEPSRHPAIGSIWAYKNDPARLYEVVSVANVAHNHDAHPPHVVYRTCREPTHIWVRTVENFYSRFSSAATVQGR